MTVSNTGGCTAEHVVWNCGEDLVGPCIAPKHQSIRLDGDHAPRGESIEISIRDDVADLDLAILHRFYDDDVTFEEQRVHAETVEHHVR